MNPRMHGVSTAALLCTLALVLGGCDDDDGVGPGENGEARAVITDSRSDPSAATVPARSASLRPAAEGSFSGTLTADAQVSISADGETWVDLGSPRSISLELQSSGDSTDVHGTVDVPAGTYARIRLEMEDASAHVDAGSSIGGILLGAAIDILIGTGESVVIEKQVEPFTIEAESQTTIVLDLNSEAWVNEENAEDEQVEEEEVEEACEAETERRAAPETET